MPAEAHKDDLTDAEVPHKNPDSLNPKKKRRGFTTLLKDAREGFMAVLKSNPNHDDLGRFASADNAVQAGHHAHPTVEVMQHAVDKVGQKEFEDAVTKHITGLGKELNAEDFAHEVERVARRIVNGKCESFARVLKDQHPSIGFAVALKYNPYHDEMGRFTTPDGAYYINIGGKPYAEKLKPQPSQGPEFKGPISLDAVHGNIQHALPKAYLHEGKAYTVGNGGLVAQGHTWSFHTKAQAQANLATIVDHYEKLGFEVRSDTGADNPKDDHLTYSVKTKGSTVTVTTFHAPKIVGPSPATPEQQAAMEKAKLKLKVPDTMPEAPKLSKASPFASIGYNTTISDAQKLFQKGDLAGLKAHARDAADKLRTDTNPNGKKITAYLGTLSTALEQHQLKNVGTPTEQGDLFKKTLTPVEQEKLAAAQAKAKEKHDAKMQVKAAEEMAAKYHEASLAAANFSASGQWSKSKTALSKIDTVEKKLVKYGMPPEKIAAMKADLQTKFEDFKQAEQQKMQDKVTETFLAKQAWVVSNSNEDYEKLAKLKAESNAMYKAAPGFHSYKQAEYMRVGKLAAGAEKNKALYSFGQAIATKSPEAEALSEKAKKLGATNDDIAATITKHTLMSSDLPKTQEEALEKVKQTGLDFFTKKAGKYDYDGPYDKGMVETAHEKYQAAKDTYTGMGGNPANFIKLSGDLMTQGEANYANIKVEANAKQQKSMDDLSADSYNFVKTLHDHGIDSQEYKSALAKYDTTIKSTEGILSGSKQEAAKAAGMGKFALEIKNKSENAKTKIKDAYSSYYQKRDELGLDHPDTQTAMAAAHVVTEQYANDLVSPTADVVKIKQDVQSSLANTKQLKAAMAAATEKFKAIGTAAAETVAKYDEQADSFHYPLNNKTFASVQGKEIKALTDDEREILSAYTGSTFTGLNKAAGHYGTDLLLGKEPKSLGSYQKKQMQDMDSAFEKIKLGENVMLRRNFAQKYFWNQLGIPLEDAAKLSEADAKKLLVGKIYKETAYSSTSMDQHFGSSYASAASDSGQMVFKIRAGKFIPGVRVKSISNHSGEEEVVLGRGTTYVIRDISKEDQWSPWTVKVDAIGMYPDPL